MLVKLLKLLNIFNKQPIVLANSYTTGINAEQQAVKYLKKYKYKIIATNYKTKLGEIDIIALKNNTINVFEVKYRSNPNALPYTILTKQQQRINNALQIFLKQNPKYYNYNISNNVVLVSKTNISIINNAW